MEGAPHYPGSMSMETAESASLRATIAAHREALDTILSRYGAANPRLFGSVARGDATSESDIDLLVDLMPDGGNELLRVAGIAEELSGLLETRVDVVATSLLRGEVSASAFADSVAVRPAPTKCGSPTSSVRSIGARTMSSTSALTSSDRWRTTPCCATSES